MLPFAISTVDFLFGDAAEEKCCVGLSIHTWEVLVDFRAEILSSNELPK